ncbi:MAG: septal ring lytic transglycosylase RlpA family protein [Desulfomonile sp.]
MPLRISIFILFILSLCGCAGNSSFVKSDRSKMYVINGKSYQPMKTVKVGYKQKGVASWYGPGFHGKKTASGEIYDMNTMTAAHSELPLNTVLRVTNLSNKKEVIVRINDRGPFIGARVIDMSLAGAKELGMISPGTVPVRLEVIANPTNLAMAKKTLRDIPSSKPPIFPNPHYTANPRGFLALLKN